jgi:cell division protein FtsB
MDRPVASASQPSRPALRAAGLVRIGFIVAVALSLWLSIPPAREYLGARDRAVETHQKLDKLKAEETRLQAQSKELSRGSGLEEQARRQGLIDPGEKSYVIEGLPQP